MTFFRSKIISSITIFLGMFIPPGYSQVTEDLTATQLKIISKLAKEVIDCSQEPCIRNSRKKILKFVGDNRVSDGAYTFSNLQIAFPWTKGILHGIIEWSFEDSHLDWISFKLLDFQGTSDEIIGTLENSFPGCEMELDDESEWSCMFDIDSGSCVMVELFFGSGIFLLDIS